MATPPSKPYIKRLWEKYQEPLKGILDGVIEALTTRMPWIYVDADMFGEFEGEVAQKAWEGPIAMRQQPVAWLYVGIHPLNPTSKRVYFYVLATNIPLTAAEEQEVASLASLAFPPGTPRQQVTDLLGTIADPDDWARFAEELARHLQPLIGPKEWSPREP